MSIVFESQSDIGQPGRHENYMQGDMKLISIMFMLSFPPILSFTKKTQIKMR